MTQYVINIGAIPNDGTGDPLRTAFNETNLNFNQVFAAGPVLSNIQIVNNKILTTNTNGNLVLAPNGTGIVQSNVSIVPNTANIRNLGSATQRWATIYTQYINVSSGTSINGDLTVAGNLTVQGNIIQVGNIVTETLTIQLANAASNSSSANGAGITVGANDNIATVLYNSTSNVWTTNIGISSVGNVAAPYFIGDGSQLTGLPEQYGNANVAIFLADFGSNTISTTGNISGNYLFGDGSQLTGISSTGNLDITGTVISIANGVPETSILISPNGPVAGQAFVDIPDDGSANTANLRIYNSYGNIEISSGDLSNAGQVYSLLLDNTGNLSVPNNVNFNGGSIQQVQNEDFYIRIVDEDDDGWGLYNRVNDGDGTTFAQTRLQRDEFSITTDYNNDGYSWTFDNSGRLNLPGNIQGGFGSNISIYAYDNGAAGSVELKTISYIGDTLGSNIRVTQSNATISTGNAAYTWTFDNTGNLNTPQGGYIGAAGAKGDGTMLTGGLGQLTSVTSYYADAPGIYSSCVTANPDGMLNITTYGNGTGQLGQWTFSGANLTLPTISLGDGLDEQTVVLSQRRLIPPFRQSAVIDGGTPAVVYTATDNLVTSMKVTVQVQHSGLGMEFFEVFATESGNNTYYTVSNRVAPPEINASTVVVDLNEAGVMQITVTINSGSGTSWVTYDAVEFGIPND